MHVWRVVHAVLMPWWIEIVCLNREVDFNWHEYTKMNVVTNYRAWRYEHERF